MESLALNETRRPDGNLVLDFSGTVDDATVERFERRLDGAICAESRHVVVDLSRCQLDSAGLAALVRLRRRSTGRPELARLVVADVDLRRMLQIVGQTSQFPTYPTLAAALDPTLATPAQIAWSVARRVPREVRAPESCPVRRANRPLWIERTAGR